MAMLWLIYEGILQHLAYLESTNITLIELDMNYQQRKEKLTELFKRRLLEMTA